MSSEKQEGLEGIDSSIEELKSSIELDEGGDRGVLNERLDELKDQIPEQMEILGQAWSFIMQTAKERSWDQLISELDGMGDQIDQNLGGDLPVYIQGGISSDSMLKMNEFCQELQQAGRFEGAYGLLQLMVFLDSENPEMWNQMGVALIGQNKLEQAAEVLSQGRQFGPAYAPVLLTSALCAALQNMHEANEYMNQAMELFRNDTDMMHQFDGQIKQVEKLMSS